MVNLSSFDGLEEGSFEEGGHDRQLAIDDFRALFLLDSGWSRGLEDLKSERPPKNMPMLHELGRSIKAANWLALWTVIYH